MTISNALLKPYLNNLQRDFEDIFRKIGFEPSFESTELKSEIQRNLHTIEELKTAVTVLENHHKTLAPFALHAAYKEVKRSHHQIKRALERLSSNQERVRKMQEKRSHVAVFAA